MSMTEVAQADPAGPHDPDPVADHLVADDLVVRLAAPEGSPSGAPRNHRRRPPLYRQALPEVFGYNRSLLKGLKAADFASVADDEAAW